jgi:hypothetical protein
MKHAARVVSYLFHPLLMPTLGLLLIFNSGTYLALLDPAAKRAILFVMTLGTVIFPVMIIPVLYYRQFISQTSEGIIEERWVPLLIILILYVITFVYFVRLPLSQKIHAYALSVPLLLFFLVIISLRFRICLHMAALGGITGLVLGLILLYETPLQNILVLSLLASGITGSTRLWMSWQRPVEVYSGYLVGLVVVLSTLLVY